MIISWQGVGKVRIEPFPGHIVDVFVTHTCASDDNADYRQLQVNVCLSYRDIIIEFFL